MRELFVWLGWTSRPVRLAEHGYSTFTLAEHREFEYLDSLMDIARRSRA